MPDYQQWNAAIIEYSCGAMPAGSGIYLSIDDDAIAYIGREFLGQSYSHAAAAVLDFVVAVRDECLTPFGVDVVNLDRLFARIPGYAAQHESEASEPRLVPKCAAFLAAMVMAAHRMYGEETDDGTVIDEKNYFIRLREVLRMSRGDGGRFAGLRPAGIEERLWREWNKWIRAPSLGRHGRTWRRHRRPLHQLPAFTSVAPRGRQGTAGAAHAERRCCRAAAGRC